MLPFASSSCSCSCSCSCLQGCLNLCPTGSLRVWSQSLFVNPSVKGEELRDEAAVRMETPQEDTQGGWAPSSKEAAAVSLVLIIGLVTALLLLLACRQEAAEARRLHSLFSGGGDRMRPQSLHRKLLRRELTGVDQPSRLPGGGCPKGDIVVIQGASSPLPNGIPGYTVEIVNRCPSGCAISAIHLSCSWFSSALLVNPGVFRCLRYEDCLVNNGKPLPTRETLSFPHANSYPWKLSASSASCS